MGRYDYNDLMKKALATDSFEDKKALFNWFESYGEQFWNGEYYDCDNGYRLFPVYGEPNEDGDCEIIDFEIR